VGFVGKTGSGKTTLIDLIIGLIKPKDGNIKIDGLNLNGETIEKWQSCIGYVPQNIFLSDDSILKNVAYGVKEKEIDIERARDAARRAQILDMILNELPNKWNTKVGERGVRLSGGQRQRIGIARALYQHPSVLVLDEATSSLDQSTESSVISGIYELDEKITTISIAHRISTVESADKIVMLENGKIAAEGEYKRLIKDSKEFSRIA
jgi:ATP-binding cassette subfamily C protein